MKVNCNKNLDELNRLLVHIPDSAYSKPCNSLSGASIGQHIRHIIEFYLELLQGVKNNEICYDNRKRNKLRETNVKAAIEAITSIKLKIASLSDGPVTLKAGYSNNEISVQLNSSVFRELAYNLEHSIHHQALIKTGLHDLGLSGLINENFGVASSTTRFKKEAIKT